MTAVLGTSRNGSNPTEWPWQALATVVAALIAAAVAIVGQDLAGSGVHGDPKHPSERPQPQYLVDEGTGAGEEEQEAERGEEDPCAVTAGMHRGILLADHPL